MLGALEFHRAIASYYYKLPLLLLPYRGGPFQRLEGDRFSVENYRNSHPQRELIEGRLAGTTVNPPG